jgi:hypothetical protein
LASDKADKESGILFVSKASFKDLLLVQDASEVPVAQDIWGVKLSGVEVIAWTPSAVDGLLEAGISFSCPYDSADNHFDWEEIEDFYENYAAWCNRLDSIVSKYYPVFSELNIKPFSFQALGQRQYFNAYYFETKKIQFLRRRSPRIINYFHYEQHAQSILCRVLEVVNWPELKSHAVTWHLDEEIKQQEFPPDWVCENDMGHNRLWRAVARWLRNQLLGHNGNRRRMHSIGNLLCAISGGRLASKNNNILVISSTNAESNPVLCELVKDKNIRLIHWNDCLIRSEAVANIPKSKIIDEIEDDEFLHNFVTYHGVDCWPMIKPYMEKVVREHLEIYLANVSRFLILHNRCKIHMVVTAYELPLGEAIFQQCERLSIPHIVFLHGGTVGFWRSHPFMYQYFRGGKHHHSFVYTEAIKGYLEDISQRFHTDMQIHTVGSTYYRLLRKGLAKRPNAQAERVLKICYVCGTFGPLISSDIKGGSHEDSSVYRMMCQTVEILGSATHVQLYLKYGRNIERHSLSLFQQVAKGKWPNVKYIDSGTNLTELFDSMDAFLMDFPSTPLCEVQSTEKPFLALMDPRGLKLVPVAEDMLRLRGVLVSNDIEFLGVVQDIAIRGWDSRLMNISSKNNSFYQTFCWSEQQRTPHNSVQLCRDILRS